MTISTTQDVLFDGQRRAVIEVTGISDGSGEISLGTIVDPETLNPPCSRVTIRNITGNISYGIVELYWDALVPKKFAELSDHTPEFDYESIGGLNNNHAGTGATGKVLLSTAGFSNGSTYMLKLELVKKYN